MDRSSSSLQSRKRLTQIEQLLKDRGQGVVVSRAAIGEVCGTVAALGLLLCAGVISFAIHGHKELVIAMIERGLLTSPADASIVPEAFDGWSVALLCAVALTGAVLILILAWKTIGGCRSATGCRDLKE